MACLINLLNNGVNGVDGFDGVNGVFDNLPFKVQILSMHDLKSLTAVSQLYSANFKNYFYYDQNFDASGMSLFKRKLSKKVFFKKRWSFTVPNILNTKNNLRFPGSRERVQLFFGNEACQSVVLLCLTSVRSVDLVPIVDSLKPYQQWSVSRVYQC